MAMRRVGVGVLVLGSLGVMGHSAAFEPLGYGAAAKGMGGAYVALAEDGTAAYWNPAGLALVKDRHFSAAYEDLYGLGLLRYAGAGYTHPNVGKGTLSGQVLHLDTQGEASFFNYAESTYMLSYGRKLCQDCMSVGVGMRYYSAYGTDVKGTGLGFDLGVLYRPFNDRLRLALAWQDINRPRIDWDSGARDNLPYTVRAGAAGRITPLTDLALQYDKRLGEPSVWRMGLAQRFFSKTLTLRGGLHRSGRQGQWGPSIGGGIRYKSFDFDYAWDSLDDLGNAQTFSMAMRFGQ
ncbi:MAG: hypothetical protein JNK54_10170 [Elusimicrobia bacterium]|nr:hypothetical protein [Elusimicrobiota bacterium]